MFKKNIRLPEKNIFEIINDFRERIPVDIESLLRALGMRVKYEPLDDSVSGMIERVGEDDFIVTVNADHPQTRQRFTLAHELGHYVYHRSKMGDGIEDNRAYRSSGGEKYRNSAIGRREETQANRLAVNILMPLEAIERLLKEGVNDPAELAKIFNVSKQAMDIRLESFNVT